MNPIPRRINDDLHVLPQIQATDVEALAKMGFKTLINNRPDGEEPGQPSSAEVLNAGRAAGMTCLEQPVVSGAITFDDAARFRELLDSAEKPVVAYCRSGTRCAMLWALGSAGSIPTETILASTASAGYNFDGLRMQIEALARSANS